MRCMDVNILFNFCSSIRLWVTHCGQYFPYFRCPLKMACAVLWLKHNMSWMSFTVHRLSFLTVSSTAAMTEGRMTQWACPGRLMSLNGTCSSWNYLFHSITCANEILFSPYAADFRTCLSLSDTPSTVKKRTTHRFSFFTVSIFMLDAQESRHLTLSPSNKQIAHRWPLALFRPDPL